MAIRHHRSLDLLDHMAATLPNTKNEMVPSQQARQIKALTARAAKRWAV